MDLKEYFEKNEGLGVLSTADGEGRVNSAVYARPYVMEDGTLGFIMSNRLTYANLQKNPSAFYLFKENGTGYSGKRLCLRKVKETDDGKLIEPLRRRRYSPLEESEMSPLHLVLFAIESERPLIGAA